MIRKKTEPITERMTHRARVYMAIATARHFILGMLLFTVPQFFTGAVYGALVDAVPLNGTPSTHLQVWGIAMLITALVPLLSTVTANPNHARLGLKASIGMTAALLSGLTVAVLLPGYTIGGYAMFVLLGALMLKDMSMLRDPLRNPFEEVAEAIKENQTGNHASLEEVDEEIAQTKREWRERGLNGDT